MLLNIGRWVDTNLNRLSYSSGISDCCSHIKNFLTFCDCKVRSSRQAKHGNTLGFTQKSGISISFDINGLQWGILTALLLLWCWDLTLKWTRDYFQLTGELKECRSEFERGFFHQLLDTDFGWVYMLVLIVTHHFQNYVGYIKATLHLQSYLSQLVVVWISQHALIGILTKRLQLFLMESNEFALDGNLFFT